MYLTIPVNDELVAVELSNVAGHELPKQTRRKAPCGKLAALLIRVSVDKVANAAEGDLPAHILETAASIARDIFGDGELTCGDINCDACRTAQDTTLRQRKKEYGVD